MSIQLDLFPESIPASGAHQTQMVDASVAYREQMALSRRRCRNCGHYNAGRCGHYDRLLPNPDAACKCQHFTALKGH